METEEHMRNVRARIRPDLLREVRVIAAAEESPVQALIVEGLRHVVQERPAAGPAGRKGMKGALGGAWGFGKSSPHDEQLFAKVHALLGVFLSAQAEYDNAPRELQNPRHPAFQRMAATMADMNVVTAACRDGGELHAATQRSLAFMEAWINDAGVRP
jgi:hypothetical protein